MENSKELRASTDLITYLNYISTWETESDENIDNLIKENDYFLMLDDFNSDKAVDNEFDEIYKLACSVRDQTIAVDAVRIAENVAAISAIWTFGFSMAAFASLAATRVIQERLISKYSGELNQRLASADTNISNAIGENVKKYILKYKENNHYINAKAPVGLDTRTCRSNLFQFMGAVQKKAKKLDAKTFRSYAESARILYNSEEINKVYNALDELNFSKKTAEDIKKCMEVIKGINIPPGARYALDIILPLSFYIMAYKFKISIDIIKKQAVEAGLPAEEVNTGSFEVMDAIGKFATAITVTLNIVDIFLAIFDMIAVVQQCKEMCDKLNNVIRVNYKDYFNGIKHASIEYKKAIKSYKSSMGI